MTTKRGAEYRASFLITALYQIRKQITTYKFDQNRKILSIQGYANMLF